MLGHCTDQRHRLDKALARSLVNAARPERLCRELQGLLFELAVEVNDNLVLVMLDAGNPSIFDSKGDRPFAIFELGLGLEHQQHNEPYENGEEAEHYWDEDRKWGRLDHCLPPFLCTVRKTA